jgi:transketolase
VGGLHSAVAELLVRERTLGRHLPLALGGRWFKPALLPELLDLEGFSAARLADRVEEALLRS